MDDWQGPLYGLNDTWTGSRWVGGHGRSEWGITHVELGHGDPFDLSSPMVRVRTELTRESAPGDAIRHGATRLAMSLWHEGAAHELVRPAFSEPDALSRWDPVALDVSEQPVSFRSLTSEHTWGAIAEIGAMVVSVLARTVPVNQIGLVTVDPHQYL